MFSQALTIASIFILGAVFLMKTEKSRSSENVRFEKYRVPMRSKKLRKFIFENQKYLIRPIANINELITEGEKLNHCIGTYAKKYAKGKTVILVVRDIERKDIPFITVEFKDNKVYQSDGKNNSNPKKDVLQFLEQYEDQLELITI